MESDAPSKQKPAIAPRQTVRKSSLELLSSVADGADTGDEPGLMARSMFASMMPSAEAAASRHGDKQMKPVLRQRPATIVGMPESQGDSNADPPWKILMKPRATGMPHLSVSLSLPCCSDMHEILWSWV